MKVEIREDIKHLRTERETLDITNFKEFKQEVNTILEVGDQIVLDLSSLRFVDSAGLGVILSVLRFLNENNGKLVIWGMRKPVQNLFSLVRLHRLIDFFETKEDAVAALKES